MLGLGRRGRLLALPAYQGEQPDFGVARLTLSGSGSADARRAPRSRGTRENRRAPAERRTQASHGEEGRRRGTELRPDGQITLAYRPPSSPGAVWAHAPWDLAGRFRWSSELSCGQRPPYTMAAAFEGGGWIMRFEGPRRDGGGGVGAGARLSGTTLAASRYLVTSTSQIKPSVLHSLAKSARGEINEGTSPLGARETRVPGGMGRVQCPSGTHVVSGGYEGEMAPGVTVQSSHSVGNGWSCWRITAPTRPRSATRNCGSTCSACRARPSCRT